MRTRRRFLRDVGVGSAFVASISDRPITEALGQEVRRKNLIYYINSNGLVKDHTTAVDGAGGFDLGSFSALDAIRDQVTLISPMNNPVSAQLHGNWFTLTGVPSYGGSKDNENPGGPSIDRAIAQVVGGSDPFSSVNLSTYTEMNSQGRKARGRGGFLDGGSADGRGAPFPAIHDPAEALVSRS